MPTHSTLQDGQNLRQGVAVIKPAMGVRGTLKVVQQLMDEELSDGG